MIEGMFCYFLSCVTLEVYHLATSLRDAIATNHASLIFPTRTYCPLTADIYQFHNLF